MEAHQAPPSLGFSRQEHWSGLPFPSPMHESEERKWSRSVVSYSSRPHGLQPTRLLHPWNFPGKSTGVGCHFLLQEIFPTQESNLGLPHCRQMLYHLSHQGSPLDYKGNPSALSFYLSFFLRQGLGGGKMTGLSSKSTSCQAKSSGTHTEKRVLNRFI